MSVNCWFEQSGYSLIFSKFTLFLNLVLVFYALNDGLHDNNMIEFIWPLASSADKELHFVWSITWNGNWGLVKMSVCLVTPTIWLKRWFKSRSTHVHDLLIFHCFSSVHLTISNLLWGSFLCFAILITWPLS